MTDRHFTAVRVSRSKPGDIVPAPSNGEAVDVKVNDEFGDYFGVLIEWQNNSDAWIVGDNNVSLSGEV